MAQKPLPGERTQAPRVLREEYGKQMLTLTVEGVAGTEVQFPLAVSGPNLKLRAEGAEIHAKESVLALRFPDGEGWKTVTATVSWSDEHRR